MLFAIDGSLTTMFSQLNTDRRLQYEAGAERARHPEMVCLPSTAFFAFPLYSPISCKDIYLAVHPCSCIVLAAFALLTRNLQLGPRRPTSLPINVGAVLQRRECDRVSAFVCPSSHAFPLPTIETNTREISFVVDSADKVALPAAKEELHNLLSKESIATIPLLVLGNKSDLPDHLEINDLVAALDLETVSTREVSFYGISAKEETNLDAVLKWLIAKRPT